MLGIYLQGLVLGAALILPLGPQNVFIMNQGIRRQYHLTTALLCALSDVALICAGVFGGSALLARSPLLMQLVTWGGVAFLLWYGWGAWRTLFRRDAASGREAAPQRRRWRAIVSVLAVTWLNPHVYLDTFVILVSLGGQFTDGTRHWFVLGCITASFLWFFSLATLAAWLAPWLRAPQVQRAINLLVGAIMWALAGQLARSGWQALA